MQRPLATVVIGGVIGAMAMSLLVLRVLYLFFDAIAHAIQWFLIRYCHMSESVTAPMLGLFVEERGMRGEGREEALSSLCLLAPNSSPLAPIPSPLSQTKENLR